MATETPRFTDLRRRLSDAVDLARKNGASLNRIAKEIGISRPGLQKILEGDTGESEDTTQEKITRWLNGEKPGLAVVRERRGSYGVGGEETSGADASNYTEGERELLQYFSENHSQVGALLSGVLKGVADPLQRRLVALTVLTAVKRSVIEMGRPIPQELWDLEQRWVGGS